MSRGGFWSTLLRLVFPARCVLCGGVGLDSVCEPCKLRLEPVGQCCTRCGRQRRTAYASPDCGECHGAKLGFARARSSLVYNAAGRELLAEFKFNRRDSAGAWLAQQLTEFVRSGTVELYGLADPLPTCVVPVPIHKSRRRERGFNQSETLAIAAAASLQLPCHPELLERTRPTPTQVGLSEAQRRDNVRGAFAVPERQRPHLDGLCVLLVDDLMTTGATLSACAHALRRGGARAVLALTAFSTTREVEGPDWSMPATSTGQI